MINLKFEQIINNLKETIKDQKVLLACSTGVDSMVLLDLLLKATVKENITVVHINHQKREQSTIEEEFIKDFSKSQNITCFVHHLPHYDGSNFQEWARKKRYEYFYEDAKLTNSTVILLAHHADDNFETIIMRLLRSSSIEGYAGIRKEKMHRCFLIYRPLLDVSKASIYEYANESRIKFFEDSSNQENDYTRNRIRHYVIPKLKEENSNWIKAIENYSNTLFMAADYFEKIENDFIKEINYVYNNNDYYVEFMAEKLLHYEDFLQMQILFRILKPFNLSKELVKEMLNMIKSSQNKIVSKISNELLFVKEYGKVIITNRIHENEEFYLEISESGTYKLPNESTLILDKNICTFITSKVKIWYNIHSYPIIVRTRKDGDKLKLKSGTKSVSNYLTDKKVPYLERTKVLLLCDSNNQPISILGFITK